MATVMMAVLMTSLLLCVGLRGVMGEEDVLGGWANTPRHLLSRSCMYGFGISGFYSVYDMAKKDRLWRVHCSRLSHRGDDRCWWTYEMVNELKENFKFNCENNSYISGVYSDYDEVTSDRTWRVECCRSADFMLPNCVETDFVNEAGRPLEFYLPSNKALRGIYSYYDQKIEDRRWRYHICDIERRRRGRRGTEY